MVHGRLCKNREGDGGADSPSERRDEVASGGLSVPLDQSVEEELEQEEQNQAQHKCAKGPEGAHEGNPCGFIPVLIDVVIPAIETIVLVQFPSSGHDRSNCM